MRSAWQFQLHGPQATLLIPSRLLLRYINFCLPLLHLDPVTYISSCKEMTSDVCLPYPPALKKNNNKKKTIHIHTYEASEHICTKCCVAVQKLKIRSQHEPLVSPENFPVGINTACRSDAFLFCFADQITRSHISSLPQPERRLDVAQK